MDKNKNAKTFILFGISVSLILFTVFHFSIIILHVIPTNPLSLKHRGFIDSYTQPLFSQNWHLFAPDPLVKDNEILVKAKYKNEEGKSVETEWINGTEIFISNNNENFISPTNRMARITSGLVSSLYPTSEIYVEYNKKTEEKRSDDNLVEDIFKEHEELTTEQGVELINRFGSSVANYYLPNEDIEMIQVRLSFRDPVPYSERNNPNYKPDTKYMDLGWQEYSQTVPVL